MIVEPPPPTLLPDLLRLAPATHQCVAQPSSLAFRSIALRNTKGEGYSQGLTLRVSRFTRLYNEEALVSAGHWVKLFHSSRLSICRLLLRAPESYIHRGLLGMIMRRVGPLAPARLLRVAPSS